MCVRVRVCFSCVRTKDFVRGADQVVGHGVFVHVSHQEVAVHDQAGLLPAINRKLSLF